MFRFLFALILLPSILLTLAPPIEAGPLGIFRRSSCQAATVQSQAPLIVHALPLAKYQHGPDSVLGTVAVTPSRPQQGLPAPAAVTSQAGGACVDGSCGVPRSFFAGRRR